LTIDESGSLWYIPFMEVFAMSGQRKLIAGILSSMVWANAFLVVPEEVTYIPAGVEVEAQMLDWPEAVF
jgi:molybdopterin biosynthesis enzyme